MQVAYPFKVNGSGRTANQNDEDDHIHNLIEQVLFTTPGERVNRPDFGTGLMQFVFAANSDETTAALQFLVQGALQKWLGDLIDLDAVQITSEESHLNVLVQYRVIRTQRTVLARFES
jgi:phage baseplate assembly protein W